LNNAIGVNKVDDLKCECGHVNPEGTVLCEACGKPVKRNQHIDGNDQKKLLNMRYEGSARRSNTYKTNIIDKIWRFFSSVQGHLSYHGLENDRLLNPFGNFYLLAPQKFPLLFYIVGHWGRIVLI
jgi:hypothetical protein